MLARGYINSSRGCPVGCGWGIKRALRLKRKEKIGFRGWEGVGCGG